MSLNFSYEVCFVELLHRREGVKVAGCGGGSVHGLEQQRNPQGSGHLNCPQGMSCD